MVSVPSILEDNGRSAVNTMFNRLANPGFAPARIHLQGELVVRLSTNE